MILFQEHIDDKILKQASFKIMRFNLFRVLYLQQRTGQACIVEIQLW